MTKKKTNPPPKVVFTEAEKELIATMAYAVWSECAYDILTSVADEAGKQIDDVTVPREVAMEIALDAGRLEQHMIEALRHQRRPNPILTADLIKRVQDADYDTMIAAARSAFTFARYGT